MPPKKQDAAVDKVWLGRPKNNVKIGLVGLPNVGKSSLFNCLGKIQVAAENYPFCTIDPTDTSVEVPDMRFTKLCNTFKPKSEKPAVLTVTDIAGLVKGAAEGKGLGNAFLSNIQGVDAIYHVLRAFVKKDIEHVEGNVDPVRDLQIIRGELLAKDIEWMTGHVEGLRKILRAKKTKENENNLEVCEKCLQTMKDGKEARFGDWKAKDAQYLVPCPLLTSKPVVVLVNVSKKNYEMGQNQFILKIKEWVAAEAPGDPVIPYCVEFEQSLLDMEAADREKFLADNKTKSMLPQIIKTGYKALGLINFFTCGSDEVRAWSLRDGSKAPQAAGVIHGDFETHFICADCYQFKQLKELGFVEAAIKEKGLLKQKGKDYVVEDGDILLFKHNAGGAGKKK